MEGKDIFFVRGTIISTVKTIGQLLFAYCFMGNCVFRHFFWHTLLFAYYIIGKYAKAQVQWIVETIDSATNVLDDQLGSRYFWETPPISVFMHCEGFLLQVRKELARPPKNLCTTKEVYSIG